MAIEIKQTADGSHTLFVSELNEHYHSTNGSIQEALHIFINLGLKKTLLETEHPIELLEIGFGTGLNCLLTCLEANKTNRKVNYTGIETVPIENVIVEKLNFPYLLGNPESPQIFQKIHHAAWETMAQISENFALQKIKLKIQEAVLEFQKYQLVYFDAFAPDVQPELWTEDVFKKIYHLLAPNGMLVTYSSKGLVKQNLRAAGFVIERLAGPLGKRHILRATKCSESVLNQ